MKELVLLPVPPALPNKAQNCPGFTTVTHSSLPGGCKLFDDASDALFFFQFRINYHNQRLCYRQCLREAPPPYHSNFHSKNHCYKQLADFQHKWFPQSVYLLMGGLKRYWSEFRLISTFFVGELPWLLKGFLCNLDYMHFIIYSKCRYYTGGLLELQACLDRSIPLCPICCDAAQMLHFLSPARHQACDFWTQSGCRNVAAACRL